MTDSWQDLAACAGTNDPIFFPSEGGLTGEKAARLADARYCRACPVRVQCLQSAIDRNDAHIWAGTTHGLRYKLSIRRDRVKCPGCFNASIQALEDVSVCTACGLSWKMGKSVV